MIDAASARPGGRTARVRTTVLDATVAELIDHGYAGLTVDGVAARAGVNKTRRRSIAAGVGGSL
jgi:AcrR family transcriptional regulator